MTLTAEWVMSLTVEVGPASRIGTVFSGVTNFIPIVGGTVQGNGWTGRVLNGGADWNTALPGDLTEFDARYSIETSDGSMITIHNTGTTFSDLDRSLFKTRTTFLVDRSSRQAHLLHGIHVGTLDASEIERGHVKIEVYRLP